MTSSRPSALRRFLTAVVAVALVLQPLGAFAAPVSTILAEGPLQGLSRVKPNIMFTLDESDSVALDYLPDYVVGQFGDINLWCRSPGAGGIKCDRTYPPYMSGQFNKLYYDPAIWNGSIYVPYSAGVRDTGEVLPFQVPGSDPWTRVYKDGFANYPNENKGGTVNLKTEYADEVYCWKAAGDVTADDLATADVVKGAGNVGDGSVCRRNGKAYDPVDRDGYTAVGVAAGYNYPNDATTAPCANSAAAKCVFGTRKQVAGNPYYYMISSVKFCPAGNAKGWGVDNGACATRWSPINKYVSYGAGGFDRAAFVRTDIVPFDGTNAYGRTYAQEMDNFAMWYAFARTRILALKTASGIGFASIRENRRVGFNTLNTPAYFRNVQDFTPANKSAWFTTLYSVPPTGGATPSIDALWRVGEYFSNRGAAAGLPGAADPLDRDTGKCQLNYHLLATDGYWQQAVVARAGIGNQDGVKVPNLPHLPGSTGFKPGDDFPLPYREGAGANSISNTMADVAMYYWINDIRPDHDNNVKDPIAPWQHVTFFGLSLGAVGTLSSDARDGATGAPAEVASGAKPWPKPSSLNPAAIDDLWHAAVNSRGYFYNDQTPADLARDMVNFVNRVGAQDAGTGTAIGISSSQIKPGESFGYLTSYVPADWSGDVRKYALDPQTGVLPVDKDGNPVNAPVWSAAAQLDAQAAGDGWDKNRRIVTIDDSGKGVPFRINSLSDAQRNSLNKGWAEKNVLPMPTAQAVLDFLRGDRSHDESRVDVATDPSAFRARSRLLGDIVNSAAVPVGAPRQPYDDAGNPGYTKFAADNKLRTPMVYVGANDGMVHALNDSNTADAGKEAWAFVPRALFDAGDPNDAEHKPSSEFQLGALTYRNPGIPSFDHKFYVNATPRAWDIDFANTDTSNPPKENDWRTILVGGLGAGGRAVYALDVTKPGAMDAKEAGVASRVLWEFTDKELGYVYDAPTLVKTKRYGWVVLVASGYNNPGGKGFLYILNPKTGTQLREKMALPGDTGTDISPTGVSTIRAFTASRKDPYVLQAYGGDLMGNVWRFDLSDPDETKWNVELIAKLTDDRGSAQPITTGVRIEIDQSNNVDRYLFVGTGKMLGQADVGDASVTNTLYVIRDGTRTAVEAAPKEPYSRADLNSVKGACVDVECRGAVKKRGWYQDASDATEKIITDVYADVQTVVYSFSKPADDPCDNVFSSRLFARDFNTGASVLQPLGGGPVVASIGDVGAVAGVSMIQGASGDIRMQVTTTTASPKYGQVFSFGLNLGAAKTSKHRVSWRLINSK